MFRLSIRAWLRSLIAPLDPRGKRQPAPRVVPVPVEPLEDWDPTILVVWWPCEHGMSSATVRLQNCTLGDLAYSDSIVDRISLALFAIDIGRRELGCQHD